MYDAAETELLNLKKLEAFRVLDMEWAEKQMLPHKLHPYSLLVGLHKARYECPMLEASYRHESAEWLRERGFKGMYDLPLLPRGQLPI